MEFKCWRPGCNSLLRKSILVLGHGDRPLQEDDVGYFIRCPACGAKSYPPQALCAPTGAVRPLSAGEKTAARGLDVPSGWQALLAAS